VLESVEDLLKADSGFGFAVEGLPYMAVGTAPDLLNELKSLKNVLFDFLAHFLFWKVN
jgi:hypothetical protein